MFVRKYLKEEFTHLTITNILADAVQRISQAFNRYFIPTL